MAPKPKTIRLEEQAAEQQHASPSTTQHRGVWTIWAKSTRVDVAVQQFILSRDKRGSQPFDLSLPCLSKPWALANKTMLFGDVLPDLSKHEPVAVGVSLEYVLTQLGYHTPFSPTTARRILRAHGLLAIASLNKHPTYRTFCTDDDILYMRHLRRQVSGKNKIVTIDGIEGSVEWFAYIAGTSPLAMRRRIRDWQLMQEHAKGATSSFLHRQERAGILQQLVRQHTYGIAKVGNTVQPWHPISGHDLLNALEHWHKSYGDLSNIAQRLGIPTQQIMDAMSMACVNPQEWRLERGYKPIRILCMFDTRNMLAYYKFDKTEWLMLQAEHSAWLAKVQEEEYEARLRRLRERNAAVKAERTLAKLVKSIGHSVTCEACGHVNKLEVKKLEVKKP